MDKKIVKNAMKICAFIAIANLPFLTITHLVGMDSFLDSFDNPEAYRYYQSSKLGLEEHDNDYVIIQRAFHEEFSIIEGDDILYTKDEGMLMCSRVLHVSEKGPLRYYVIHFNDGSSDDPIYEQEIIGKVVSVVDNNAWNHLSLKLWDVSINKLNAVALFAR